MLKFQEEKIKDFLEELKPLLEKHYEEIAYRKDKIKLNPDYERYLQLDALGLTHSITVRDGDRLVGYYISVLSPNLHYKDHLYSVNDILYIDTPYRGGTAAYRMFKFVEKKLKDKGVSVMTLHMKTEFPFDRLCTALGMDKLENLYIKYIGD